jgi:hypothetical protein
MADQAELDRLLSLVVYESDIDSVEGLFAFCDLLETDSDGRVLQFLKRQLPKLDDRRRGGIAWVLAGHYFKNGDLKAIRRLFATDDDTIKASALDAVCGEPTANPQLGPGIVELAIEGARHPSAPVRTAACVVFQNQAAWGVDVSAAIGPLRSLLADRSKWVRHQAGYAAGNLAKGKYDLSPLLAQLRRNLKHNDQFVHGPSAWALWQMSRSKHDIGPAVPELVQSLKHDEDWEEPRRNSAGALLHHAKKSADNAQQVRRCVRRVRLDSRRREIKRFLEQLANL